MWICFIVDLRACAEKVESTFRNLKVSYPSVSKVLLYVLFVLCLKTSIVGSCGVCCTYDRTPGCQFCRLSRQCFLAVCFVFVVVLSIAALSKRSRPLRTSTPARCRTTSKRSAKALRPTPRCAVYILCVCRVKILNRSTFSRYW